METMTNFEPINYDAKAIPPDLPAGGWTAVASTKLTVNKNGRPMLIVNWTVDEADEGDNDSYVGARASDFITFCAPGDKGERPNKQALHSLAGLLGIDLDIVPRKLTSLDDLRPFVEAVEGQKAHFKTYLDKGNKTRFNYTSNGRS